MIRGTLSRALGIGMLAAGLAACGGTTTLVSTPVPSTVQVPSENVDSPAPETPSSAGSTDASPESSSSLGSRQNPAPIGSTALISDTTGEPVWEVTLLESELNVNDVVAKENQFNEPPPDGFQFAAAKVSVTYLGPDKGFPGMDLMVAFVSEQATTHLQSDLSVVGPDQLSDENELYSGGNAVGFVYVLIPSEGADAGTWRISQFLNDSEFFFTAQ